GLPRIGIVIRVGWPDGVIVSVAGEDQRRGCEATGVRRERDGQLPACDADAITDVVLRGKLLAAIDRTCVVIDADRLVSEIRTGERDLADVRGLRGKMAHSCESTQKDHRGLEEPVHVSLSVAAVIVS